MDVEKMKQAGDSLTRFGNQMQKAGQQMTGCGCLLMLIMMVIGFFLFFIF